MAFESDFLDLMADRVTVVPATGFDAYGNETLGTPVAEVPAHITTKTRTRRTDSQENDDRVATVIFPPPGYIHNRVVTPTITQLARLDLADGQRRIVIEVTMVDDEDGTVHHQSASVT